MCQRRCGARGPLRRSCLPVNFFSHLDSSQSAVRSADRHTVSISVVHSGSRLPDAG